MDSFEYFINEKEKAPAGQVYLGAFLAAILFFAFFFGSLLFFISIVIVCIFIFLDKDTKIGDEFGRIKVVFNHDSFTYAKDKYAYNQLSSFTIYNEVFGVEDLYIRIKFKIRGKQDLFIPLSTDFHLKSVYDIIRKSVKEDKNKSLNFTEQLFLKFF